MREYAVDVRFLKQMMSEEDICILSDVPCDILTLFSHIIIRYESGSNAEDIRTDAMKCLTELFALHMEHVISKFKLIIKPSPPDDFFEFFALIKTSKAYALLQSLCKSAYVSTLNSKYSDVVHSTLPIFKDRVILFDIIYIQLCMIHIRLMEI